MADLLQLPDGRIVPNLLTITAASSTLSPTRAYDLRCNAASNVQIVNLFSGNRNLAGYSLPATKIDATANTVTFTPAAGQTINGAANYVLSTQWQSATLVFDGVTNWIITAKA